MSLLAAVSTAPAVEDDIPDDLFAGLPSQRKDESFGLAPFAPTPLMAIRSQRYQDDDPMATLPTLPSLEGLAARLADVNLAIDAARAEADSLKEELQRKAGSLRAMAAALEAI